MATVDRTTCEDLLHVSKFYHDKFVLSTRSHIPKLICGSFRMDGLAIFYGTLHSSYNGSNKCATARQNMEHAHELCKLITHQQLPATVVYNAIDLNHREPLPCNRLPHQSICKKSIYCKLWLRKGLDRLAAKAKAQILSNALDIIKTRRRLVKLRWIRQIRYSNHHLHHHQNQKIWNNSNSNNERHHGMGIRYDVYFCLWYSPFIRLEMYIIRGFWSNFWW